MYVLMNVVEIQSVAPDILAVQLDVGSVIKGKGLSPDQFSGDKIAIQGLLESKNFIISSNDDSEFATPIRLTSGQVHLKSRTTDIAFLDKKQAFSTNHLEFAQEHTVFLELPDNIEFKPGKTYSINFSGVLDDAIQDVQHFTYQPETLFSEAIHVSQLGFDPDDPKVAFLSLWRGQDAEGNSAAPPEYFSTEPEFWIVDAATGKRVEGDIVRSALLTSAAGTDEDIRGGHQNYSGTDVYTLDFSNFDTPGKYHLYVDGVGKSFDFEIAENTWEKAFQVSMKGLYNQRSGTAIGGDYSNVEYERSFHPDDGVYVYATDQLTTTINGKQVTLDAVQLVDSSEGLNLGKIGFKDAFKQYVSPLDLDGNNQVTDSELSQQLTTLDNAWGGYKDAGDWDRRVQHLWGTRQHLELLELFPEYFETVDLGIPQTNQSFESTSDIPAQSTPNALPDLLDESLWSVEFFKRLQNADGGVRGGIESAAHPNTGETSWEESQAVFAYAADPWSSYIYAGVAARISRVLEPYDADLAQEYRDSAIKAMDWAEAEFGRDSKYDVLEIRDERNLAALELYLTTENAAWHELFLETTVFTQASDTSKHKSHNQQQAAYLYARTPKQLTDSSVRQHAEDAILRAADNSLAVQNGGSVNINGFDVNGTSSGTAFKWTKSSNPWEPLSPGKLSTPQVDSLLQAYTLSGDKKYINGAVLGSQFSAGANPLNTVFTTGLVDAGIAQRGPDNPFVIDARLTGQDAPAGITVYGPLDPQFGFAHFQRELYREDSYLFEQRPVYENYFDNYWNFEQSEFTIHQTIAPTAYTWGFLAASDFEIPTGDTDKPVSGQEIPTPVPPTSVPLTPDPLTPDPPTPDILPPPQSSGSDSPDLPKLIVLRGTDGGDLIKGQKASEQILGLGGADVLRGDAGQDELRGGAGSDTIQGGADADRIFGDADADSLNGQLGNDSIRGGHGNDRLLGDVGNDLLEGQQGNDTLAGGAGTDHLVGGSQNDKLIGGTGTDTLVGQSGDDTLKGGDDNDLLLGGKGMDSLRGHAGSDTMIGGNNNDKLFGDAGADEMVGGAGNDTLNGGSGADGLNGGAGNDRVLGADGDDRLLGGTGADDLNGGMGNDTLMG
ncbi:MAG: glycoside hydrolase family 9 protein, partial [Cyanobacteria bacterium P01_E01_bin.34]